MKIVSTFKRGYLAFGQKLGAALNAPSKAQGQAMLFILGTALLSFGMMDSASAVLGGGGGAGLTTRYNDQRMSNAINAILTYLEGTFGALIMVAAGIGAILSAAFGQYRAALGCLVVAVGAFILRSFLATFFNDSRVRA